MSIPIPATSPNKNNIQDIVLGWDVFSNTAVHTGSWKRIQCLGEQGTTFATLTDANSSGDITTTIFPKGIILHGQFTVIMLSSGSVLCERGA
jgi:hypothetical protein